MEWLMPLWDKIYTAFIESDRYIVYLKGVVTTLEISLFAVIIGIVIGTFVAVIKYNAAKKQKVNLLEKVCNGYINIIRGTPVYVQLLIMNSVVFASASSFGAKYIAALTFGINSGAYVAEIIRAGISSVDKGQFEAGTCLGLNNRVVMRSIILPQAVKNILPALGNEFITLVKETAIAGAIAVNDLTKAAERVGGATYDFKTPLLGMAIIYFMIVMVLTKLLRIFERKLAKSDNN